MPTCTAHEKLRLGQILLLALFVDFQLLGIKKEMQYVVQSVVPDRIITKQSAYVPSSNPQVQYTIA